MRVVLEKKSVGVIGLEKNYIIMSCDSKKLHDVMHTKNTKLMN